METFRALVERFWVEKQKDRELYRKIQREAEKNPRICHGTARVEADCQ